AWLDQGAVSIAEALSILGRAIAATMARAPRDPDATSDKPPKVGLLGQNLDFDVARIDRAWTTHEAVAPGARRWWLDREWHRYSLDTRHLCAPLYAQGKLKSRS